MKRVVVFFLAALTIAFDAHAQTAPNLTAADVDKIVGQALAEAAARNATNGSIAVTDRVGNVLGVYALDPNNIPKMTISSGRGIAAGNGLETLSILPAYFGAIAKAVTGAYLSSSGNAFTSRTASQIVQEHFNPGEKNTPSGPLFGVQFSQLTCSDLVRQGAAEGTGPRRSPLGLSADPGGLPLYKNGQVVGGVGVLFDGVYGLDLNIQDYDQNLDELIAVAGQQGFTPPVDINGRITADAKILHTTDVDVRDLKSSTPAAVNPANYIAVTGYTPAGRRDGMAFGATASGIRAEGHVEYPTVDAWVLDDGFGNNRYVPRDSLAPAPASGGLSAVEVRTIITEALKVAFRARAQIRRPVGSFAQVSVSVVDTEANVLAVARTPDAPIFGTDVSLQKARTAAFNSRPTTAAELRGVPAHVIAQDFTQTPPLNLATPALGTYVDAIQAFVGPTALADGTAFGDRSGGLLSRPHYPDGIDANSNGPLSHPFATWSPFNVGLQLDLVVADIVTGLLDPGTPPPLSGCTSLPQSTAAGPGTDAPRRLANGLQIFPGSVPIFRNGVLIGGVGVSGDGVDQDDMVSFLGLHNAGVTLNSGVGNAPMSKRADTLKVHGINLRFVQCPFTPFNDFDGARRMLRQIGAALVIVALAAPALAAEDDTDVPRRQPGPERTEPLPPIDPNAVPPPAAVMPRESIPVPDRWRIMDSVGLQTHWWDPYNQNSLKADRPLFDDWFFNLGVVSDTVVELRGIPTPVGAQGDAPGSLDVFGRVNQDIFVTSLITSVSLIKGDTAYRPPNYEIRFTPVFNFNRVHVDQLRALRIDPTQGDIRTDGHVGLQEAFLDYHIRNVSDRYDFDSVRVGIQPLTLDFRGFLFEDQQLGVRFFGDRDNNKWQYNFGWMRRLEKDTNSGLNDLSKSPRKDDVVFANLFAQDLLVHGYTIEGVVAYNRNREGDDPLFYNKNGFLERPADIGFERPFNYDVVYLGLNGDGHFGRFNLTNVFYAAVGNISANPFTSATRPESASISAFFAAAEPSMDFDWLRVRGSFLFASGDGNPFDNKAHGFDAIFENPQFAGAETSYWIRQPVPLIGGGSLQLSGRDGVLANLRSSKEQGQSNFINPGTLLIGAGVDADVLPELRLSANVNHLSFVKKGVIEVLRDQALDSRSIGWDTSISAVYRPSFIQNVVSRLSGATLWGGRSFKALFNATPGNGSKFYSVLFNMILTY